MILVPEVTMLTHSFTKIIILEIDLLAQRTDPGILTL